MTEEDTDETGCDILANLPRDDVTPDEPTFEFSDTSMPPTFSLTLHGSERHVVFVIVFKYKQTRIRSIFDLLAVVTTYNIKDFYEIYRSLH